MAIRDKVSGAYQDIETLKVPVNGAMQEADHANALVDGAWQEVWSSGYSFTPSIYNASYGTCTPQGSSAEWNVNVNVSGYAATVKMIMDGGVDIPANTEFDVSFDITYANWSASSGGAGSGGTYIACYDANGNAVASKNMQTPNTSTTVSFTGLKSTTNPIEKITITMELNGSKFSYTATVSNLTINGTKCKFV